MSRSVATDHEHEWIRYHVDYCHKFENGEICECGEKRHVERALRDFGNPVSRPWAREGCIHCDELLAQIEPTLRGRSDV
jgi:hypothetical protein